MTTTPQQRVYEGRVPIKQIPQGSRVKFRRGETVHDAEYEGTDLYFQHGNRLAVFVMEKVAYYFPCEGEEIDFNSARMLQLSNLPKIEVKRK